MFNIKEISYGVFGKCVEITNGQARVVASLDFGPRVLAFSYKDMDNMFYNDETKTPLHEKLDIYGGDQIILYGGHRVWISPEILPRCYHPDNIPCTYEKIDNGIYLKGAVEQKTQIQKNMQITLHPDKASVNIVNEIVNLNQWDIELAPWSITMMDAGGYSIIPLSQRETGFLPNRCITFWDYSDLSDTRFKLNKEYITLKQTADIKNAFKLGMPNENGWAAYVNKGQIFIKFIEYDNEAIYPDNGSNYETYVNGKMLEMEALGEVVVIPPGEAVTLEENWDIIKTNGDTSEADVYKKLAEYAEGM